MPSRERAPGPEAGVDPAEQLGRRLALLGLRGVRAVRTHRNRTVMVTLTPWGVLRLHRGYAQAPDRVLRAIVRFLQGRLSRAERQAARREFLTFPVEAYAPPPPGRRRRGERPRPGDVTLLHRLEQLHRRLNAEHFGGRLRPIVFRLSGRMRTRLGEFAVDLQTGQREIAVSRIHLRVNGWDEVEHTVLHEMVHQWQAEQGRPIDHGAAFRRKARDVGITPRARRRVPVVRPAARGVS